MSGRDIGGRALYITLERPLGHLANGLIAALLRSGVHFHDFGLSQAHQQYCVCSANVICLAISSVILTMYYTINYRLNMCYGICLH